MSMLIWPLCTWLFMCVCMVHLSLSRPLAPLDAVNQAPPLVLSKVPSSGARPSGRTGLFRHSEGLAKGIAMALVQRLLLPSLVPGTQWHPRLVAAGYDQS